jgi:hypothetical protein
MNDLPEGNEGIACPATITAGGHGRAPSGCRRGAAFLVSVQRSAVSYQQKQELIEIGALTLELLCY